MNLFSYYFVSAYLYLLLFYSTVVGRISDKRKCADPDCSQPISFATTLLNYYADDDRLLSFPRNLKVKVFSKEAGDNPTFWEIEASSGKRGYAPKALLRENKVLVPSNKLTHIVPTGRTNKPTLKQNATDKEMAIQESQPTNILSATPELPVANSKGLFSTIGGVSADSVPMNLQDIKPQSTRKFQVFDGTTIYDDVVTEKPESPPTVIYDTANGNQNSNEDPEQAKEVPGNSNVPSSDLKPVFEENIENKVVDGNAIDTEADKQTKKEDGQLIIEENNLKEESRNEGNQPEESGSFLGTMLNSVTNLISSGAGEGVTEEGDEDEGSAEEEDYEDEEGKSHTESTVEKIEREELGGVQQTSPTTISDTPTSINNVNESSLNPKSDDTTKSVKDTSQDVQSFDKTLDMEEDKKTAKDSMKISSDMKTNVEEEMEVDDLENLSKASDEEANTSPKSLEVDKSKNEPVFGLDLPIKSRNELPEQQTTSADLNYEQSPQQSMIQDLEKSGEVKTVDDKSYVKESRLKETGSEKDQPNDTSELNAVTNDTEPQSDGSQVELPSDQSQVDPDDKGEPKVDEEQPKNYKVLVQEVQVQEQFKTGEILAQEHFKTDPPQDQQESQGDSPHVKEQLKIDENQDPKQSLVAEKQEPPRADSQHGGQEQSKTDDLHIQEVSKSYESNIQEQPKPDELQSQEQPKPDEPKTQEKPDIVTELPSIQPTVRQFWYGSRQTKEPSEVPSPSEESDEITLEAESHNDSTKAKSPPQHPEYSSLPSVPPMGSPKYSSVISRRIQSSESYAVNQVRSDSEEEKDDGEDVIEKITNHEEMSSPHLSLQSQSPKYSSVISKRIGSFTPPDITQSVPTPEAQAEPGNKVKTEDNIHGPLLDETVSQQEVEPIRETKSTEDLAMEINAVPIEDSSPSSYSNDVSSANVFEEIPANIVEENSAYVVDETPEDDETSRKADDEISANLVDQISSIPEDGMFTWISSYFDVFGSKEDLGTKEILTSENLDPSRVTHFAEETCSADGVEGSCPTFGDSMEKEVTWQETSYTYDMWELLDRVPIEATIWLIVTAVVVLIFSLGHYYIEAHRRDGPLVALINKLEKEMLILKKENCIMEDRLQITQQELEAWNTSSSENDALLVELKQELEETKAAKAELEEQAAQLKDELETVTESGLEMHRLLEESLSSQDGSQVLLSTVETLREKLQRQEEEISGLSDSLCSKNAEVEELQVKLSRSADVAQALEDRVVSVTREKEEELLQMRDKHRELISQLEENAGRTEVMETKALDETRLSTEMSKLRLAIEELQKTLAEKDSELDTLKEVVKQLRSTDSNERIEALFDVVAIQAKLKTAVSERDDFREKFLEEEGARKLLEGHMKKITEEVAELKNSFETAEKEKIEALTKLQVLSNYFKEKESQLQKELGLQESMWLQKQSDDHTIYEQMRSLREENEKYKLQNESLKKEVVEQEASFKIQLANTEQKAHENWVASRQAERKLKEAQQEAAQLRNRLTTVEKNSANYSLDEKQNISESNGDPSSPPPSLMFPPTTSPPFMMYAPMPHGDFVPPPPLMGSPYPSDSRPPPLGRISSPPLDHRFSPPPPLAYPPYDYSPYGHHSPSPPPPLPPHHRNVHKPQPREMSREQKEHVPTYTPEAEKASRRNKR